VTSVDASYLAHKDSHSHTSYTLSLDLQDDEEPAKPLKRPEKKVKFSEVADQQKEMHM